MTLRSLEPRSWPTAISFVVIAVALSLALGGAMLVPSPSASGMQAAGRGEESVSGTPEAAAAEPYDRLDRDPFQGVPIAGDPLDGDPLDGPLTGGDPSPPIDQTQLDVVRSARPHDEPTSVAVYDDDPETVWTPRADTDETWLWLDLGLERPLREVRLLARGSGTVEIAVSSDRRRWHDVDQIDVGDGWQGLELRDDARYVRLALIESEDGEALPAIAEVALYGSDRTRSVSSKQRASDVRERVRDRQSRADDQSATKQRAEGDESSGRDAERRGSRSRGRVRTSADPGETHCRRNRERCEARQGEVSIEDDCEREGTCTIDVRVDGGTAVCEAAGGNETKAGDGDGRRGGRAGRCEAVANGGVVAIGDINP